MKKKIVEWLIAVAIVVGLFLIFGRVGWWETHYTITGRVTAIEADKVVVTTNDGNVWSFIGDGYNVEDVVEVTMWTNGTDLNRYDDEIEAVKKIA